MRHAMRIAAAWVALSVIAELLIAISTIPSPTGSPEGVGERETMYMLFYVGVPIFVFVWVLLLYAIIIVRRRPGEGERPPTPSGSTRMLLLWTGISFVIVCALASWGTVALHEISGPPRPASSPADSASYPKMTTTAAAARPMIIQVIGRQWLWIFRYPSYGGMETRDLVVPYNVPIRFHITSLDVVHSFWIYDYDIKEDAVPGWDNTAWFLARKYGSFTTGGTNWVKCNELCGMGHSHMVTGLYVRRRSDFVKWARAQEQFERSIGLLKRMPKYAAIYYLAQTSRFPVPPKDV